MIADHPLGAGGDGFAVAYGGRYLNGMTRPIHNGYLTEAADGGWQGSTLRLLLLASTIVLAMRTLRIRKFLGDGDAVIIGACLLTSVTAYLGTSFFGDYIDEEWGYWMIALIVVDRRLYALDMPRPVTAVDATTATSPTQVPLTDVPPHLAPGAAALRHKEVPS